MYSCNKDKTTYKNNNEIVDNNLDVSKFNNLFNFRDQIKSPLKTTNTISCDSAMWYMEALMNASNSRPDSIHPKNAIDTAYFSMQLDSAGMVPINIVSTTYYEMRDTIFQRLAELESETKDLWGADLQIQSSVNTLDFMVIFVMGYDLPWGYDPFTEDDDWIFGHTLGYCSTGAPPYSDGGEELEWRLNHPYFAIGGVGVIIEIHEDWKVADTNSIILYYKFVPGDSIPQCMENEELTDRLWLTHDAFYNTESNGGWSPNETWTFENCNFFSFTEPDTVGSEIGYKYYHGCQYWYAERADIIIHD